MRGQVPTATEAQRNWLGRPLSLRTDPARSISVRHDRFRCPFGFSTLGRTVLMTFTHNREWLRELISFIFVFAVERCSLPARQAMRTGITDMLLLRSEHEQKQEGSPCCWWVRGEVRRVATPALSTSMTSAVLPTGTSVSPCRMHTRRRSSNLISCDLQPLARACNGLSWSNQGCWCACILYRDKHARRPSPNLEAVASGRFPTSRVQQINHLLVVDLQEVHRNLVPDAPDSESGV